MTCAVTKPGASDGFCTRECKSKGSVCEGAAAGTRWVCSLSDQTLTRHFCAFVCEWREGPGVVKIAACPPDLRCDSVESPPGSGQRPCLP
jgi:hypothetical protein